MFKIGDFSKLSQVSVKALRYYDEIGLLKPARVDRFTGYRFYSADQLPRLNRILALKDMGLSLEQIAPLLDEGLPPAQIRGMLRLKRVELQRQLEDDRARLARVEARLRQIEEEDAMPSYDVVLKKVEPQTVAAVREVIPTYGDVGRLFSEIGAYLGQHQTGPTGPSMAIYYDTEYRERDVDVEAAMPVGKVLPAGQRVTVRELPGGEMACAIHRGSYDGIGAAYAALMKWIDANGYRAAGPNREIYLRYPGAGYQKPASRGRQSAEDPAGLVTEVQFPVEKV